MPEYGRWKRLILGQGGSTLIELLVAMPLAIMLMFAILTTFSTAAQDEQRVERRTEALTDAQRGLERMTREFRQANWVYFRNSQIVDLEAMRRATPTSQAVPRLVRFNCSGQGCVRYEGPAVTFPPPTSPTFESQRLILGGSTTNRTNTRARLMGRSVFEPRGVDPSTGVIRRDFLEPDMLQIHLWLKIDGLDRPVEMVDGVSLRNLTGFE